MEMDIVFADLPLPLLLLVRRTGGRADEPEEVDAAAAGWEAVSSSSSSITMGILSEKTRFKSKVPKCPMLKGVDSELPMSKFQTALTFSFLLT